MPLMKKIYVKLFKRKYSFQIYLLGFCFNGYNQGGWGYKIFQIGFINKQSNRLQFFIIYVRRLMKKPFQINFKTS